MSSLLIPCEYGPSNPRESIVVDACEGSVNLDVARVTEPEFRHLSLTTQETRALAAALLHYADEIEEGRA